MSCIDHVTCTVLQNSSGGVVASASYDRTVRLWDSSTGVTLQTLEGHSSSVTAAVISPDGKLVASTSYERKVRLWDLSTGVVLHTCMAQPHIRRLFFSKDGSYLETENGCLDFLPALSNTYCPHQPAIAHPAIACISLQDRWIVGTMGDLLWLTPDYKAVCSDVRNSSVVLGHASAFLSFIRFDLSQL